MSQSALSPVSQIQAHSSSPAFLTQGLKGGHRLHIWSLNPRYLLASKGRPLERSWQKRWALGGFLKDPLGVWQVQETQRLKAFEGLEKARLVHGAARGQGRLSTSASSSPQAPSVGQVLHLPDPFWEQQTSPECCSWKKGTRDQGGSSGEVVILFGGGESTGGPSPPSARGLCQPKEACAGFLLAVRLRVPQQLCQAFNTSAAGSARLGWPPALAAIRWEMKDHSDHQPAATGSRQQRVALCPPSPGGAARRRMRMGRRPCPGPPRMLLESRVGRSSQRGAFCLLHPL